MERSPPRTLRFAVTGSLLATAALGAVGRGCVDEDRSGSAAFRDDDRDPDDPDDAGEDEDADTTDDGDEGTFGDTIVINPGPQLDLGTPPADPDLDVTTPPPPPIVNPGRVPDAR